MNKKPKQIYLSEVETAFLDRMKEERQWTHSYTLHQAIDLFMSKNTTPTYIKNKELALQLQAERLKRLGKGEPVNSQQITAEFRGRKICEAMEGTITDDGYCIYKTYGRMRGDMRITELKNPLEFLTQNHIDNQYDPSKEEYLKFCEGIGVDPYKL